MMWCGLIDFFFSKRVWLARERLCAFGADGELKWILLPRPAPVGTVPTQPRRRLPCRLVLVEHMTGVDLKLCESRRVRVAASYNWTTTTTTTMDTTTTPTATATTITTRLQLTTTTTSCRRRWRRTIFLKNLWGIFVRFFTGRMPFLSPNQQCRCIEKK